MNVCLVCNTGLSTAYLENRVKAYAKSHQLDLKLGAVSFSECLDYQANNAVDLFLLAPQLGFKKDKLEASLTDRGVNIRTIAMGDYGTMNVENILTAAGVI